MELTVNYFGMLKEETEIASEKFECKSNETVTGFLQKLRIKYPAFDNMKYQVAINNNLVNGEVEIPEGAEISLLPPFAGG